MANTSDAGRDGQDAAQLPAGRPRRRRRDARPPLTSMIDVTFQLLLFFLLTCEFRPEEGLIPSTLPRGVVDTGRVGPGPEPIGLSILPAAGATAYYRLDGSNETILSPRVLHTRLRGRQDVLGRRDVPVVIRPPGAGAWRHVAEAFNQVRRARFTKVAFAPCIL